MKHSILIMAMITALTAGANAQSMQNREFTDLMEASVFDEGLAKELVQEQMDRKIEILREKHARYHDEGGEYRKDRKAENRRGDAKRGKEGRSERQYRNKDERKSAKKMNRDHGEGQYRCDERGERGEGRAARRDRDDRNWHGNQKWNEDKEYRYYSNDGRHHRKSDGYRDSRGDGYKQFCNDCKDNNQRMKHRYHDNNQEYRYHGERNSHRNYGRYNDQRCD